MKWDVKAVIRAPFKQTGEDWVRHCPDDLEWTVMGKSSPEGWGLPCDPLRDVNYRDNADPRHSLSPFQHWPQSCLVRPSQQALGGCRAKPVPSTLQVTCCSSQGSRAQPGPPGSEQQTGREPWPCASKIRVPLAHSTTSRQARLKLSL